MHDSVPVWLVSRAKWEGGEKKEKRQKSFAAALYVMQTFYSAVTQGVKTVTAVVQIYSNSLLSRSIQTPKKSHHRYKPFV